MPSADAMGRVAAQVDPEGPRRALAHVYERLKRGKALPALPGGLMVAVLDGHESHATRKRCCEGCLQRQVETRSGSCTEYYHRHVSLQLVGDGSIRMMLDAEPLHPGEGEVDAAIRLLDRVLAHYPRAFDVVLGDALYAQARFFRHVRGRGKHAMAVLKQENRDLYRDAAGLWAEESPRVQSTSRGERRCWDLEGLTSWPQYGEPVRVVRCEETTARRRQLDRQTAEETTQWVWVMTMPSSMAPTSVAVRLGHERWSVENQGFNELVNEWHGDHVYKHEPTAILVFGLLTIRWRPVHGLVLPQPQARASASAQHAGGGPAHPSRVVPACGPSPGRHGRVGRLPGPVSPPSA